MQIIELFYAVQSKKEGLREEFVGWKGELMHEGVLTHLRYSAHVVGSPVTHSN